MNSLPEGFPDVQWSGVGEGWWPIITELHEKLLKLAPDYEIHQVKEKFGGLRYYVGGFPEDVYDEARRLIDDAEARSYKTCEECGEPGEPRNTGWVLTLCDACAVKRGKS